MRIIVESRKVRRVELGETMGTEHTRVGVGIIGGGPSGVACARAFLEEFRLRPLGRPVDILVIEKARVGPGLPFAGPACLVVNQRASTMGVLASRPREFAEWLKREGSRWKDQYPLLEFGSDEHPPRALYGQYVADVARSLGAQARKLGHRIRFVNQEAVALRQRADYAEVTLASGATCAVHHAVLAIGNLPPSSHIHLLGAKGYYPTPWPIERLLAEVDPLDRVYVLGTSLSAVDVANAFSAFGHQGGVTLISRTGRVPKVLGPAAPHELLRLTPGALRRLRDQSGTGHLPLAELGRLLLEEVTAIIGIPGHAVDWREAFRPPEDVARALAEDIAAAGRGPLPWQAVLRATLPIVDFTWGLLSQEDQIRFDACSSLWSSYRHSMAPATARRLLASMEAGAVDVLGGLQGAEVDHDGRPVLRLSPSARFVPELHLGARRDDGNIVIRPRVLINATGSGSDLPRLVNSGLAPHLLAQLLDEGWACPYPAGGLRVDASWNLVRADGRTADRLYAIGHLTKGTIFYCSGMDKIAALARHLASVLGERIGCRRVPNRSWRPSTWPRCLLELVPGFATADVT